MKGSLWTQVALDLSCTLSIRAYTRAITCSTMTTLSFPSTNTIMAPVYIDTLRFSGLSYWTGLTAI